MPQLHVRARSVVLAALLASLASACGGSSGNGSSELAAGQSFAAEVMQQVCDALGSCCTAASFPSDPVQCAAAIGPALTQQFTNEAVPGTHMDQSAAQRCLAGIADITQTCTAPSNFLSDDCKWVFVGTVSLGGQCDNQTACAPSNGIATGCVMRNTDNGDDTGDCELIPPLVFGHAKAGDPCTTTCIGKDDCLLTAPAGANASSVAPCYTGDGLYCSLSSQCVPQGKVGDGCFGSDECDPQAYCEFATFTCGSAMQLGDTCENDLQCESHFCSGTCVAPPLGEPQECLGHQRAH